MVPGWRSKYLKILREFGYDEGQDVRAARVLDAAIGTHTPVRLLADAIEDRVVFVVGAGPSLHRAMAPLKEFLDIPRIAADGVLAALMGNGIGADVVVTDLDGDLEALRVADRDTIFVVHAHGDNIDRLGFVKNLTRCIGTTQATEQGKIHNFGGFTDGDRAVFLAEHFGARRIILLGMDFGDRIGRYSFTRRRDRPVKLRKMRTAQDLLVWLASQSRAEICTTSRALPGIRKIDYGEIRSVL